MISLDVFCPPPLPDRHIGPDAADQAVMLARLGSADLDALIGAAVPPAIRARAALRLSAPAIEVLAELAELTAHNRLTTPTAAPSSPAAARRTPPEAFADAAPSTAAGAHR